MIGLLFILLNILGFVLARRADADPQIWPARILFIIRVLVTQLDFMRALDSIITNTSLDDWKTWLKWSALNASATYLNEDLDKQNFEFYSKTLRGIEEQRPRWRRGVNAVNANLGEVVGKVYITEHFPPEAKERMLELVNNLIKAYEISIKELDWMGEETKAEALDKLSKFTPKIGYPDVWLDYAGDALPEHVPGPVAEPVRPRRSRSRQAAESG